MLKSSCVIDEKVGGRMEAVLRGILRWIIKNPLVTAVILVVIAARVAPGAIEALIINTTDSLLQHVLLPLLPLGIVIMAILATIGRGRIWGKKKG